MREDDARLDLGAQRLAALTAAFEDDGYLAAGTIAEIGEATRAAPDVLRRAIGRGPGLSVHPPPRVSIRICRDVPCALRGATTLAERVRAGVASRLDVEVVPASCLGRCDAAPVADVNEARVDAAGATTLVGIALGRVPPPPPAPAESACRASALAAIDAEPPYEALRRLLAADGATTARARAAIRGSDAAEPVEHPAEVASAIVWCDALRADAGAFGERALLAARPGRVVEGLLVAARLVGAPRAIVAVRSAHRAERAGLERALDLARADGLVTAAGVERAAILTAPPGTAGERADDALLEVLATLAGADGDADAPGSAARLRRRRRRFGVVELVRLPRAVRATIEGRSTTSSSEEEATVLVAVSGDVARPGVHALPAGAPLRAWIDAAGGVDGGRALLGAIVGRDAQTFVSAADVAAGGRGDGAANVADARRSASLVVLAVGRDPLAAAASLVRAHRDDACDACTAGRLGCAKALEVLERVLRGTAEPVECETLPALHAETAAASRCRSGRVGLVPALSALAAFPARVRPRRRG